MDSTEAGESCTVPEHGRLEVIATDAMQDANISHAQITRLEGEIADLRAKLEQATDVLAERSNQLVKAEARARQWERDFTTLSNKVGGILGSEHLVARARRLEEGIRQYVDRDTPCSACDDCTYRERVLRKLLNPPSSGETNG